MAADSSARACSRCADLGVERAEAEVAVGHERAHAEFLGQGEGLAVVGFGLLDLRGITPCRNVAEEAQGIRLVATFLVRTGERQRPLGEGAAPPPGGQPADAPPQERDDRAPGCLACHCRRLFHRLREQRHGVGDAPDQGIRRTQGRSHPGK